MSVQVSKYSSAPAYSAKPRELTDAVGTPMATMVAATPTMRELTGLATTAMVAMVTKTTSDSMVGIAAGEKKRWKGERKYQ